MIVSKGDETRAAILEQALDQSTEVGLEGLSVGTLARRVGMSKSGLYAHFDSKEDLQCQVLDTAAERFVDLVVRPALERPRGRPRVEAFFELWLAWSSSGLTGGCPFVAAATEFDDRPGPVRDTLAGHLRALTATIARAATIAVEEGHFRSRLDTERFAFDVWAIVLAYHHYARLLDDPAARGRAVTAFETLVDAASRRRPTE